MAVAGALVAAVLDRLGTELRPGITTLELDAIAEEMIRGAGGSAVVHRRPRAHRAVQALACASRSTMRSSTACPGSERIRDGQIVSIDAGAIVDGWHGDAARTFDRRRRARRRRAGWSTRPSARCTPALPRQCRATTCPTSRPPSRTSRASRGYGVVRAFVGHGIGTEMHEEPQVPNYRTGSQAAGASSPACAWRSSRCSPSARHDVKILDDGWTVMHRGRLARRALGAHDRRYGRWAAHPDHARRRRVGASPAGEPLPVR